jgi:LysR family transcriptional regulator (chromosome initiation inhibitor)
MIILRNPLLQAFEAVHEQGTTHAAAKTLGLTQTGVTQRIKTLERELGIALFLRSRRGMKITTEGLALLQLCREARELEAHFHGEIAGDQRRDVELTLAGPTSAISTRVATDVLPLYRKHPFLRLHLRSHDHADLVSQVRRGEADLAIVPPGEIPNEMEGKNLKPDRYLLVGSADWKGRRLGEILETERAIDYYEKDLTTNRYLEHFSLARPARARIYANENEALVRLFAAGAGFGTLTESVAKPYLESGDLIVLNKGQALEDPLALAWYPRSRRMPYFDDVVKAIR